jgi:hypothetical protein
MVKGSERVKRDGRMGTKEVEKHVNDESSMYEEYGELTRLIQWQASPPLHQMLEAI